MTKKHFIQLADTIRESNERREHGGLPPMFDVPAIQALADFCSLQNPHFNRGRWIGYIYGSNGPNGGKPK